MLIEKISKGCGILIKPYQITKKAQAEAKAAIITAQADIEKKELYLRAEHRVKEEELRHQENMEQIVSKSTDLVRDDASPNEIDDDWLANFFNKARIISDDEMQLMWSRVLAGEVNKPGSISRKTINLLNDLDKADALLFQNLCRFSWDIDDAKPPLIFDYKDAIYKDLDINFDNLSHLDSLGLIHFNEFQLNDVPKSLEVDYIGRKLTLNPKLKLNGKNDIRVGYVLFSRAGKELANIIQVAEVEGFYEYVEAQWKHFIQTNEDEQS